MAPAGLFLVDKPPSWTSHDVVARARRLLGTRRVGHAGTLDPMATGLLVCGCEQGTRLLNYLTGADKEYDATIRIGTATDTEDAQGHVRQSVDLTAQYGGIMAALPEACEALTGTISQVPSSVSAIKVAGKRAYQRVREGEDVVLPARTVVIHAITIHEVRAVQIVGVGLNIDVDVTISCSSGTYIRAIARDLGGSLGTHGHLTALRRTRVGNFVLADAQLVEPTPPALTVISTTQACRRLFPVVDVDEDQAARLRVGQRVPVDRLGSDSTVAIAGPDGEVIAVAKSDGEVLSPKLVFAH